MHSISGKTLQQPLKWLEYQSCKKGEYKGFGEILPQIGMVGDPYVLIL